MSDAGRGGPDRHLSTPTVFEYQLVATLLGDSRRLAAVVRETGWDRDATYRTAERLHDRGWLALDSETGLYRVRPVAAEALADTLVWFATTTNHRFVPDDGPDASVRRTTLGGAE
jgi:hypothetical protein